MHAGTMPLVSIVTPSFKQARFLRRTIDSVLSQDYPHIEYIVVDGGSADGSVDILRSYGDRLRWVSEPDRGQSDAINKGFVRCNGAIRAYLNSDDVLWPGAVRAVVEHFEQNPDWDLVYGNAYNIDADDRILERYPTARYQLNRLLQNCFICQPAAFWRSRIARRIGPFNANLHYAMDLDYWLRIDSAGGRLMHVPEVLACARVHPATKTLSARPHVYREILQVCMRHADQAGFSQYFAYWHHRCHEAIHGWPRWLRLLPRPETWLALLHARWDRHRGRPLRVGADLLAALGRRLRRRRRPVPSAPVPSAPLPEGWLPPCCSIAPVGDTLRLAGSAPKNVMLNVSAARRVLMTQPLRAHRKEVIEVAVPASCTALRLTFSGYAEDALGRQLAFCLDERQPQRGMGKVFGARRIAVRRAAQPPPSLHLHGATPPWATTAAPLDT
jgi:glycosyltransferase involved in cell wall biosynthesis